MYQQQRNVKRQVGNSKSPSFSQIYSIQNKSQLKPSRNHQDQPHKLEQKQGDQQIEDIETNDQNQQQSILTYPSKQTLQPINKQIFDQSLNEQQINQMLQDPVLTTKVIPKAQQSDFNFKDSRGSQNTKFTKSKKIAKRQIKQQSKNKVLHQILRFFEKGINKNIPKQIQNKKNLNYKQHSKNATNFLTNLQNDPSRINQFDTKYKQKKIFSEIQAITEHQSYLEKSPNNKSSLKSTKKFLDSKVYCITSDISKSSNFNFISFIQNQNFLIMPISKNRTFQFYLKRQKSNQGYSSQNEYHLYEINNFKYLLSAVQYLDRFSLLRKNKIQNQQLGQLLKSYSGKKYQCFYFPKVKLDDSKQNIKSSLSKKNMIKNTIGKLQLINIIYQSNLLGIVGPRKMQIYIPKINTAIENQIPLEELFKKSQKIQKFYSKYPRYNKDISAYKLDFKNRQIKDSKKNFQILKNNIQNQKKDNLKQTKQIMNEYIRQVPCVRFGKIGIDLYHLEIEYPFSIIQGFALALSSFGEKL